MERLQAQYQVSKLREDNTIQRLDVLLSGREVRRYRPMLVSLKLFLMPYNILHDRTPTTADKREQNKAS